MIVCTIITIVEQFMFHGKKKKSLSWVSIFSCVLQCPLQLDSVELFMKIENLFCIWLMHTEQTFGQPNCNMFFGTVSLFLCIHWSAGFRLFPFLVTSSHMAPSLDTDKYFPWQCQHEFPFTCARVCGCVRSLPSEVIPTCSHSYQTVAITHNLSGYK